MTLGGGGTDLPSYYSKHGGFIFSFTLDKYMYITLKKAFADDFIKGGDDGLEPEVVAETVFEALTAREPKARYAPVPNKLTSWTLPRLLPRRMLDKIMAKRYGLLKD